MPMSRAEAICACNNIIEVLGDMGDKLPQEFSDSIEEKTKSMLDYILKTPQYPRVTDKMDGALRGMWGGIQKWNRKGDYNDNLFEGLEAVVNDLKNIQKTYDRAEAGIKDSDNATDEATEEHPEAPGLEEMSDIRETLAGVQAFNKALQESGLNVQGTQTGRFANTSHTPLAPRVEGLSAERIVKVREDAISTVLNQLHEKHITAIDTRNVKHGNMQDVLKATKSDRTLQLLWAAFYAGKLSGIMQLGEELSTEAGKK